MGRIELTDPGAYAGARDECDIVMKGGVTSGVVYPLAVCELATKHSFRSVGGASAGAIAAALTAAAEHGRGSPDGGFARLARLPRWLGSPSGLADGSHLFNLFQPSRATRRLHRLFMAAVAQPGGRVRAAVRVVRAAVSAFTWPALAGALPGLALAAGATGWLATRPAEMPTAQAALLTVSALAGVLLAGIGATAATGMAVARHAGRVLPENFHGICPGLPLEPDGPPALTSWLTDELDVVAGRSTDGAPLTLGDLWGEGEERRVHLEVMTTNLTHGQPHRLPWSTREFLWHPDEFRRLFPARVVDFMLRRLPEPVDRGEGRLWERLRPLVPLPAPRDLPVVVQARMSLSFPLLIGAVPLWSVDWTRKANQEAWAERRPPRAERCWFSDGGITSNMPVHFFDRLLPVRPTFAINLRGFHADFPPREDERLNVSRHRRDEDGSRASWTRIGGTLDFVRAILDTMQNWLDNAQLRVPGYRDRVVHVHHTAEEGGTNLDMPSERIEALAERGRCAGRELVEEFDFANHRWVRYRSTMALMQATLEAIEGGFRSRPPGMATYGEMIGRGRRDPPNAHRWERAEQREFAAEATSELMDIARRWSEADETFAEGSPEPPPWLRISPRF